MTEIAFGFPERSVSEPEFLRLLATAADALDGPGRVRAVIGPPGLGIRWFTLAALMGERAPVIAESALTSALASASELVVVARRYFATIPFRFDAYGPVRLGLVLIENMMCVRGALPAGARRDGEVDHIGLGAVGLPIVQPFEVLARPTHYVFLRNHGKRPAKLALTTIRAGALPIRLLPRDDDSEPSPTFERTPRATECGDLAELRQRSDSLFRRIAEVRGQRDFGLVELALARSLANLGPRVAPLLVERLQQAKPNPRVSRNCITALGMIGSHAEAVVACVHRGASLVSATSAALARMGESARPALIAAQSARKPVERALADALLRLLDDPRFAPLREARAARDTLAPAIVDRLRAGVADRSAKVVEVLLPSLSPAERTGAVAWFLRGLHEAEHYDDPMKSVIGFVRGWPEVPWGIAVYLVETPFHGLVDRKVAIDLVASNFGDDFSPIADVLLELPAFADDPSVQAHAAGRRPPTTEALLRARDAKRARAKRAKAKKR